MIAGGEHIYNQFANLRWAMFQGDVMLPANEISINPNSLDVTLGRFAKRPKLNYERVDLRVADSFTWIEQEFDEIDIEPGEFVLLHTAERINCTKPDEYGWQWVQMLDGRSTLARCGLKVHFTSGFGDYGFDSSWTIEAECIFPTTICVGQKIAQVYFDQVFKPFLYNGAYTDQHDGPKAPVLGPERFGVKR